MRKIFILFLCCLSVVSCAMKRDEITDKENALISQLTSEVLARKQVAVQATLKSLLIENNQSDQVKKLNLFSLLRTHKDDYFPLFKHLIDQKKLDPNLTPIPQHIILLCAVENRASAIAQLLLENGAEPNIAGCWNKRGSPPMMTIPTHPAIASPLYIALDNADAQTLQLLLKHGADPNKQYPGVLLPLLQLCSFYDLVCVGAGHELFDPYPQMFKLLLDYRADPKKQDTQGFTSFSTGRPMIVKSALEYAQKIHDTRLQQLLTKKT